MCFVLAPKPSFLSWKFQRGLLLFILELVTSVHSSLVFVQPWTFFNPLCYCLRQMLLLSKGIPISPTPKWMSAPFGHSSTLGHWAVGCIFIHFWMFPTPKWSGIWAASWTTTGMIWGEGMGLGSGQYVLMTLVLCHPGLLLACHHQHRLEVSWTMGKWGSGGWCREWGNDRIYLYTYIVNIISHPMPIHSPIPC